MKKILLSIMVILIGNNAWGDPITLQKALQNAVAFMQQQKPTATLITNTANKAPRKVNGRIVSDQAYYYVFNAEDNQGFVIASGDDVAVPILAYSPEGTFNEDSIPDNMRAWLKGYEQEIAWAQENGYMVDNNSSATKFSGKAGVALNGGIPSIPLTATKSNVAYLVKTTWDQGSPYYNQCRFNNSYCYTGCVATAMAQVMYYWGVTKGFQHGCTALPAYTTSSNGYSVPALSAVSSFSWSSMTTGTPTTTAAKTAVATLMRYCGQSVYMDYTPSSSGAQSSAIPPALINNFGYDKGAVHVERAKYTSAEWENLIYNELANGRPVLMDGVDVDEAAGHEFVCDGYQASSNKFHFNWGWSGSYNSTYCALSALVPGGTGSGGTTSSNGNYTGMSGAVIGIQPPLSDEEREVSSHDQMTIEALYLVSQNTLSRDARSDDASLIITQGLVFNNTAQAHSYEFCLGIYNETGELVDTTPVRNYGAISSGGGYYFNNEFSFGAEMPYGTYKIIPICRDAGTDVWYPMEGASTRYLQAVVNEKTITVSPSYSLTFSNWTSSGSRTYTNKVNITNNGLEEFTGDLYLLVNGSLAAYISPVSIASGATINYTIPYTSSKLSTQSNIIVLSDPYMVGIAYNNTSNYANVDWDMDWDGYIDDDKNLYADSYKTKFMLTNMGDNSYSHTVTATLFEQGKKVTTGTTQTKTLTVAAKSKGEVEFEFSNVSVGKTYDLQIKYYEETGEVTDTLSNYNCAFTLSKGLVVVGNSTLYYPDQNGSITIPDDALYVDARFSDMAANITGGGNTNTLYILKEGSTTPSALTDKNVVIGSNAETVTIDDGLDFYSPVGFMANDISYRRTFDKGFDGENANWSTILLPFDVQNITVEGKEIDWYHNESDNSKNLWVMDFTDEDDGAAQFDYPETLTANHPYIIAVPDETWNQWNLVGKEIIFAGQNATIEADIPKSVVNRGGKYDYIGRTYSTNHCNKYPLNAEGSRFAFCENYSAKPFRAYFVAYYDTDSQSDVILPIPSPLPSLAQIGDVNRDGNITIADITSLVDIILGKITDRDTYDFDAADLNGDGNITIADVTALVDIILGSSKQ